METGHVTTENIQSQWLCFRDWVLVSLQDIDSSRLTVDQTAEDSRGSKVICTFDFVIGPGASKRLAEDDYRGNA